MADIIENPPVVDPTDKAAIAAANAAAIQKQGDQDISGHSTKPTDNLDGSSALDALHAKAQEEAKKKAEEAPVIEPAEGTPTAAAPAGDKPGEPAATPAATPAAPVKPAEGTPAAPAAIPAAPSADDLKKISDSVFKDTAALPTNASAKAKDAFEGIKSRAATVIAEKENELRELRAKLDQVETASKQVKPLTKEVEDELLGLREFRTKFDVEADPKFKSFDKTVSDRQEFIYAQLQKSPAITPEIIEQIKKHGGPEFVNMDKVYEVIKDPATQRLVEQTLAQIEQTKFEKQRAIDENKSNVKEYLAKREKEMTEVATAHNTATSKQLGDLVSKIPWLNVLTPKSDASADDKKAIEAHNAYAKKMQSELELAAKDDSPEMRATLMIGMVQLFRLQDAYDGLKKNSEAEKADLTKKLEEANKRIEKLTSSSVSRLQQSGAPPVGQIPAPKEKVDVNERPGDALDRIREEQRKARSNQA